MTGVAIGNRAWLIELLVGHNRLHFASMLQQRRILIEECLESELFSARQNSRTRSRVVPSLPGIEGVEASIQKSLGALPCNLLRNFSRICIPSCIKDQLRIRRFYRRPPGRQFKSVFLVSPETTI